MFPCPCGIIYNVKIDKSKHILLWGVLLSYITKTVTKFRVLFHIQGPVSHSGSWYETSPWFRTNKRKEVNALLNYRQEQFCLYYAQSGNAAESYKKAGYTCKTEEATIAASRRLINRPFIKERLKELADQAASEKIADIREVQERLTAIVRGETTEEVVVVEGCGDGISEAKIVKVKTATKDVIKAGVELAKMQGGYDNKLRVEVTVPVFGGEERLED